MDAARLSAAKSSPMMETINMVNAVKCELLISLKVLDIVVIENNLRFFID